MSFIKTTLEGKHVRLEPISEHHITGLKEAVADGKLWELFYTFVPRPEDVESFVDDAHAMFDEGSGLAFATIDKASGRIVGSTRFMQASLENFRTEIGFTFIGASWQRSAINTEAKLLMMTQSFETMELNRVEYLTDYLNTRSRAAILRLGAKEEGVLRSHKLMPGGRIRDSVIFSVIKNEWAGVKQNLEFKLAQYEKRAR